MNRFDIHPLVVSFGYTEGVNKLVFITRDGKRIIDGYSNEIIDILKHCNGLNSSSEIKKKTTLVKDDEFHLLLNFLVKQGIVCDSRSLYENFHKDSSNPMEFRHNWSIDEIVSIKEMPKRETSLCIKEVIQLAPASADILKLTRSRHSVRHFKKGAISKDSLSGLLESIHGANDQYSIPSAGGLYPIEVYMALLQRVDNIKPGWYKYSSEKQSISLLDVPSGLERIYQILDSSEIVKNAIAIIFLGADFSRTALKYSNLGYRFVLMEVGHAAQNATLYCIENGLGLVEWGGINELYLAKELQLDYPKQGIVLAMVVGIPNEDEEQHINEPFFNECCQLKDELVGKGKPVEFICLGEAGLRNYFMPRVIASAKYRLPRRKLGQERNLAFASGKTTAEVSVKVIAEAFERYASGCVRVDRFSSAEKLDKTFIDPRIIAPLDSKQCERLGFESFDLKKEWQWIIGRRLANQEDVYLAIDNVFYPLYAKELGRGLCCNANSSGVAAHFHKKIAVKKALLELIERDAIAVIWGSQKKVNALPHKMANKSVCNRVDFLRSQKKDVKFLDFTLDSIPVVVCLISSEDNKYPCLASGAASDFSFSAAIERAFNEAEYMFLSWRRARPKKISNLDDVVSTLDHGRLYFYPGQQQYISWLLNSEEKTPKKGGKKIDIFYQFDPIAVDITPSKEASLSVVRVISERLMPISFGYGGEYYRHSRLKVLGLTWKWDFPAQPHFFA
jgi:thiazole/oxazole-forming peptide maturase SagD family component